MKVRALNSSNDWTYGKGLNDYVSANLAVGQMIQTRIASFLGDCFFSTGDGIDWFTLLGGKSSVDIHLSVSATILNTTDSSGNFPVTRINDLSIVLNKQRNLRIEYSVLTVYTGVLNPTGILSGVTNFLLAEDGTILTTEDGNPLTI